MDLQDIRLEISTIPADYFVAAFLLLFPVNALMYIYAGTGLSKPLSLRLEKCSRNCTTKARRFIALQQKKMFSPPGKNQSAC